MAQRWRGDYRGAWHHVTSRGIARRTMFENARDVEVFLEGALVEREEGRLEVHAYSLMTTHFHMLVRSPTGELSRAMRRLQNGYSRWFNRTRNRDGPLVRGRFSSRVIETDAYWMAVLWYIDRNPIVAGLVSRSTDWPHGSATWYARPDGPAWLVRDEVEARWSELCGGGPYDPATYPAKVGGEDLAWVEEVVERRMRLRGSREDALDDLLGAAPESVRSWMERKARLADGTLPGCPVVSTEGIVREVLRFDLRPLRTLRLEGRRVLDTRHALKCGLLRTVAGATVEQAAEIVGRSANWVRLRVRDHVAAMRESQAYADTAAILLARVLSREKGRPLHVAFADRESRR